MAYLAEVNVAQLRAPLGDPVMRGFVFAADAVYRLAQESPGFVWRSPGDHAVRADEQGHPILVNVSMWESYEALHAFAYRSLHGGLVRRRAEWFLPTEQPSTALWWIRDGNPPTTDEALARLSVLRKKGPTRRAFGLRNRFDEHGVRVATARSSAR